MVMPAMAGRAAQQADPALTTALQAATDRLAAAPAKDDAATLACVNDFFDTLAQHQDNRVLTVMLSAMTMLVEASLSKVISAAPRAQGRILEAQRNIIAAVSAGDRQLAADWMARHIADLKRGFDISGIDIDQPLL